MALTTILSLTVLNVDTTQTHVTVRGMNFQILAFFPMHNYILPNEFIFSTIQLPLVKSSKTKMLFMFATLCLTRSNNKYFHLQTVCIMLFFDIFSIYYSLSSMVINPKSGWQLFFTYEVWLEKNRIGVLKLFIYHLLQF